MTESQQPGESRDILARLLAQLTASQLEDLLTALTLLKQARHGSITITYKNGHPHTIQPAPEFLMHDEAERGRDWMRHMQDALHAGE